MHLAIRRGAPALLPMAILGTLLWGPAATAQPVEAFASIFFPAAPEEIVMGEPDPLEGIIKIDLQTGVATNFIGLGEAGLDSPTDVVIHPQTNDLFVSTQTGRVLYFDSFGGAPLPSLVPGEPDGTFAVLPNAGFGDGVNTLHFDDDGTLVVGTSFGFISSYNGTTGAALPDLGLTTFPSGLDRAPNGDLIVAAAISPFGAPGELLSIDSVGATTVLVDSTDSPGIFDSANPTVVYAPGDYDRSGLVDSADYDVWEAAFGTFDPAADGNFDSVVDAADYTVWRDNLGAEARIFVADLFGNQIVSYALDGTDGQTFAEIPPGIPDPLPPTVNPFLPASNSPSEILLTPNGTLLLSTLGLTPRPDNRGALLEYDLQGNLLQTIADGLPPLSGIALAPTILIVPIPEPSTLALSTLALLSLCPRRGGRD